MMESLVHLELMEDLEGQVHLDLLDLQVLWWREKGYLDHLDPLELMEHLEYLGHLDLKEREVQLERQDREA